MTAITDLLLAFATLCVWLGCLGFVRLRGALDRLHCATFVASTAGPAVLLATFATRGGSASVVKVVFLMGSLLLSGAVLAHAVARALTWRGRQGAEP